MTDGWYFEEMGDKAEQNADILTKHAFENDVATFVRETLQNANDALNVDADGPVEVHYRFEKLSGQELERFLAELECEPEDDEVDLYDHLRAAGELEDDRQLDQYLDYLEREDELLLLSVEDRNTQGLDGLETEDGTNYTALVRDMGRSNKDATEGGSHGVGKTVLWAFSGMSTVLFTSYPVQDTGDYDPPRFVGRTLLPDHRDQESDQLYSGNGWYGRRDPEDPDTRHVSAWGDEARERARALYTEHVADVSGTTATIVGFRDPTAEEFADVDELLETFRRSVAEYFWPAIERGNLRVYLEGPDDEPTLVDPYEVDVVRPFVDCFRERDSPDDDLESRGNVVEGQITFDLPDKKIGNDTQTEPKGRLGVYAKSPSPGDDETRLNEVAIFRGAGMVVDYINVSGAASYGSPFYGILLAGEARGWGDRSLEIADGQVEEFLRTSEPAAHDEWKGYKNSKLQSTYEWGCAGTVESLTSSKLRQCLQDLVATDVSEEGGMIDSMKRKIPRSDTGRNRSSSPSTSVTSAEAFDTSADFTFRDGRWMFDATVAPKDDDFDSWHVTVEIVTLGEENNKTGGIAIESVDPHETSTSYEIEDGVVVIEGDASTTSIDIGGTSESFGDFDPYSGRLGKSQLRIDGDVEMGGEA
ncbi:hypothetical protein ACFQS4_01385 [Saliphagus sp. GCM10025317]